MMRIKTGSHYALCRQLGGEPRSASVLSDARLIQLCRIPPHENPEVPIIRAHLQGELMVRQWLYRGECPLSIVELCDSFSTGKLRELFHHGILMQRAAGNENRYLRQSPDFKHPVESRAWNYLVTRIGLFRGADGLIPVRAEPGVGGVIAVPFNILRKENTNFRIQDMSDLPARGWNDNSSGLSEVLVEPISIRLGCWFGRENHQNLTGGSFALPVALAAFLKMELDYSVFDLLATGAIEGGRLHGVEAIEEKRNLARRLGVRWFISPGIVADEGVLALNSGLLFQEGLHAVTLTMDAAGLSMLSGTRVKHRLRELSFQVANATIPYPKAHQQATRYLDFLQENRLDENDDEWILRAQILMGAIENHCGNPEIARKWIESALTQAQGHHFLVVCEAVANEVVSLCDGGNLKESESLGRWLRSELQNLSPRLMDSKDRMTCAMFSAGALGGEPLLHKALQEPGNSDLASESLALLQEALSKAQRLQEIEDSPQHRHWLGKDAVRVALWHALFESHGVDAAVARARTQFPATDHDDSEDFLRRVQFLGGYRQFLVDGTFPVNFETWLLPERTGWVNATARKYRGTLRAAKGDIRGAEADFQIAWEALISESGLLLRLIAGSIAVQAGFSLGSTTTVGCRFLESALVLFKDLKVFQAGPVDVTIWHDRAQGLLDKKSPGSLPDPQRFFVY